MKTIIKIFALTLQLTVFFACKNTESTVHYKDYRLYLDSNESRYQDKFSALVVDLNQKVGFQAITLVSERANANSIIVLTPGLEGRDGKVGWGQWMTEETSKSKGAVVLNLGQTDHDVHYSMRLEFDKDYLDARVDSADADAQTDILKLWCHELGHGFKMDHVDDENDMMYPDIDGQKNFDKYYADVQRFFGVAPTYNVPEQKQSTKKSRNLANNHDIHGKY